MTDIVWRLRLVDPNQVLLAAPPFDTSYLPVGLLCHEAANEIERLRADAERYRWLREKSSKKPDFYSGEPKWMVSREQGGMGQNFFGDGIDAAIDAAIAEERKP